jgi:hypothetical protein
MKPEEPQTLGVTLPISVGQATWHPGFVQSWRWELELNELIIKVPTIQATYGCFACYDAFRLISSIEVPGCILFHFEPSVLK